MHNDERNGNTQGEGNGRSEALSLLASRRPRNVGALGAGALLFGDWGTSRLYVLGIAFLVAGRSSFILIAGMSLLILAVGWAYIQICRIYPDGGGVYTAAKQKGRLLGVIGALLLFADYTITASLSALEAFHYFGLGEHHAAHVVSADAGSEIVLHPPEEGEPRYANAVTPATTPTWSRGSPALWAVIAILLVGAFNLLGPKHSSGFAIFAAIGMVAITLLVTAFALPQIEWATVFNSANGRLGTLRHSPLELWQAFVSIVLALSGVEAIANLTGVMRKPVYITASRSIWLVAAEVAVFNLLLGIAMLAIYPLSREAHKEDMLAFLAGHYVGGWGEWPVRIVGGALLLSATNTAVNGIMSIIYVMSRDGEMPAIFQKLNGFGAPWVGAVVAAAVPAGVLLFANDLETLASLYAMGVVGAVAINCTLCAFHARLRSWRPFGEKGLPISRRIPMAALGILLIAIWVTLAFTKWHATVFVGIVMVVGLALRALTRAAAKRRPKPSLLRRAIMDQLPPDALAKPKLLLATAGSDQMADAAIERARQQEAALAVCFVREVALNYRVEAETRLTLDTDPAAQALFVEFLKHGSRHGVPIIPIYDTGPDAAVLIAEEAAMNGVTHVLLGTSRRGALHHLIKGSFQRRLESLLPPDIKVDVLEIQEPVAMVR